MSSSKKIFLILLIVVIELALALQARDFYHETKSVSLSLNLYFSINTVFLFLGLLLRRFFFVSLLSAVYGTILIFIYRLESILHRPVVDSDFLLLINSNYQEASEFILGNPSLLVILLSGLFFVIGLFFFIKQLKFVDLFSNILAVYLMLSLITGLFGKDVGLIRKLLDVIQTAEAVSTMAKRDYSQRNNFTFHAEKDPKKNKAVYVLVIGESARYDRWSINGYPRETSPLLSKFADLVSFHNVSAAANGTLNAVPIILTRARPENYYRAFKERSIAGLFEEAGYRTAWITMQEIGIYQPDAMILSARRASQTYDEYLITAVENLLKKHDKLFIVLHTLGSHYYYDFRYPKQFKIFKPTLSEAKGYFKPKFFGDPGPFATKQQLDNSYDNTIRYTDFVLSKLINLLALENRETLLLYTSDHGENLWDDNRKLLFHMSINASLFEIKIPLFIYANQFYKANHQEQWLNLKKNVSKPVSHIYIFHTLAALADIKYLDRDDSLSLSNPAVKLYPARSFLGTEDEVEIVNELH